MVIDLETCVGCHACTIACKVSNGTPPGVHFASVLEHEVGAYPNARREFLPILCNHCEDAPCVDVCPTGASYKRADGIVAVKSDICIGCRACDTACPYGHRHYIEPGLLQQGYFNGELTKFEEVKYPRWTEGTVSKCDFCMDRTDQGLQPACVVTCPPSARHFGDLSDPESNVARLLSERESFSLLPEAETKPSVLYLKPRSESRQKVADQASADVLAAPAWDPAAQGRKGFTTGIRYVGHMGALEALSFLGEAAGGALFILAVAAGLLPPAVLAIVLVGMAVAVLLAHLGKPMRAWRAVSKPGKSWVSRGTLAISGFVATAVLSLAPTALRGPMTAAALVLAPVIMLYGGLLLRSYRAIRFWRGPFLPLAFAAQGVATAGALMLALVSWFADDHPASNWLPGLTLIALALSAVFAAMHWMNVERSRGVQASKARLLEGDLRGLFVWGAGVGGLLIPALGLVLIMTATDSVIVVALLSALVVVCRFWGDYAYRNSIIMAGAYEPMTPHH
jgi:molybdopterin-containing oxidoreductase family iron-sulfur binding subunit